MLTNKFNLDEFLANRKAEICIERGKSWGAVVNECAGVELYPQLSIEETLQQLVKSAKQVEL
jgi:hypothetical protein